MLNKSEMVDRISFDVWNPSYFGSHYFITSLPSNGENDRYGTALPSRQRLPGQTRFHETWSRNPDLMFDRNFTTRFINRIPKWDPFGPRTTESPYIYSREDKSVFPYIPTSTLWEYNSSMTPQRLIKPKDPSDYDPAQRMRARKTTLARVSLINVC